ncbi:tRNA (adenosine(37)-N6)-threonylcarbamoyltransferase complex dimerization subunit type 1 TsaB [Rubrivirga marina]|uniref:tRNA (Adenosine(37)-N6)-threonylcarbamoyltransferase complex dimerization subunit type 1 TsaB n=1 Tax=Rubrivirga marina TaxID=1196024 RepID=A0A271J1I1_9BACT|nr:tRNA (adenosine(37)-N6)-threonylcarbamoyltransferase complex dimerization subunit type 1 TsaB [Rubrivirga marina]PAP77167.1 tRNA (adenosine(37)-N6)-threonylcarbamoyltransferase complex dimerization subunit type 1 TsaB [Rubrivirga marina]
MLTLGIDTATDVCAVALLDGERVLFEAALSVPRSHGRRLAPLLREAFAHVERDPADLGLVAVAAGPGSYTGLRIGTSTAKGLALATGAALVGVPTLRALTTSSTVGGPICAILPSRRGEVYVAVYDGDVEVAAPAALSLDAVADWLPASTLALGGPGADRLADLRPDLPRVELASSGAVVARLGQGIAEAEGPDDVAALEPLYLKPVATSQPGGILRPSTL